MITDFNSYKQYVATDLAGAQLGALARAVVVNTAAKVIKFDEKFGHD